MYRKTYILFEWKYLGCNFIFANFLKYILWSKIYLIIWNIPYNTKYILWSEIYLMIWNVSYDLVIRQKNNYIHKPLFVEWIFLRLIIFIYICHYKTLIFCGTSLLFSNENLLKKKLENNTLIRINVTML